MEYLNKKEAQREISLGMLFLSHRYYFCFDNFTLPFFSMGDYSRNIPENAIVSIDNKPMRSKMARAVLRHLGKHTLKIEADDYIGYKEEIDLKRGRNYSKKITLAKAPSPTEISAEVKNFAVKNDQIFYQSSKDDLIYRTVTNRNENGSIEIKENQAITSKPITNVDKIIWSPDKNLLLLKRGTTVNLFDFKKYDFVNQKETPYGENIGDIVWAPDDSRIAYYYAPPNGEKSIIFANKTNETKYRVANLAELGISNPYLAFSPNSEWLLMIQRNKKFPRKTKYI